MYFGKPYNFLKAEDPILIPGHLAEISSSTSERKHTVYIAIEYYIYYNYNLTYFKHNTQ